MSESDMFIMTPVNSAALVVPISIRFSPQSRERVEETGYYLSQYGNTHSSQRPRKYHVCQSSCWSLDHKVSRLIHSLCIGVVSYRDKIQKSVIDSILTSHLGFRRVFSRHLAFFSSRAFSWLSCSHRSLADIEYMALLRRNVRQS